MTPVVLITPYLGKRQPAGDMAMALGVDDAFLLAVLDFVQRQCCEAARRWWAAQSISPGNEYGSYRRKPDHDIKGWRAYMSPETAQVVQFMEETGKAKFVLEDEAVEA